jgi:hypothetical protein
MDLFYEIPCLVERSSLLNGLDLCNKWFTKSDKGNPSEALQKFISYNRRQFEFLEVTPSITGTENRCGISFRTSRFIGAIPLRAPDTGKQIGDFVVAPRFVNRERFEDYIEILDLLGQAISPEVAESLPLTSGRNFRPPFYLEAVKFIASLEHMLRKPWRKFDVVEVIRSEPNGLINWQSYVEHEYKVENKLRFPLRKNTLSEFHREFRQLRFVFDICNKELRSSNVPHRIRNSFRSRLNFIEQRLYQHKPIATDSFVIKATDRPAVKECKDQANRILQKKENSSSTAWRVDFNDVFEKFVQHIFGKVAQSIGGKLAINPPIQSTSGTYTNLEMRQLEPDAVLMTQDLTAFIDAKYKSHLFNKFENSDLLKDDFRRDLHQVFAYTSFAAADKVICLICYPSNEVEVKSTTFRNLLNNAPNKVLIVGIPLKRSVLPEAIGKIAERIDRLRGSRRSD